MESVSWDANEQVRELNAMRGHQDSSLSLSGSVLALTNAILVAEVLSVNEDTNTFLLLGLLSLVMSLCWLVVARRAGSRAADWARKARGIEDGILGIPEQFSVWGASEPEAGPTWIAVAGVLVSFAVVWIGLMIYAVYWQTLS